MPTNLQTLKTKHGGMSVTQAIRGLRQEGHHHVNTGEATERDLTSGNNQEKHLPRCPQVCYLQAKRLGLKYTCVCAGTLLGALLCAARQGMREHCPENLGAWPLYLEN